MCDEVALPVLVFHTLAIPSIRENQRLVQTPRKKNICVYSGIF